MGGALDMRLKYLGWIDIWEGRVATMYLAFLGHTYDTYVCLEAQPL